MSSSNIVEIYTDGACRGNPGNGGWGAYISYGANKKELCGGEKDTTNNRMELMGAIQALEALTRPCKIKIHTDSTYVKNGITEWLPSWKQNDWRTKARKPVKNKDLWQRLDAATERHDLQWAWVKAHVGIEGNEKADQLANQGLDQLLSGVSA
jgi:ribonuclease HI